MAVRERHPYSRAIVLMVTGLSIAALSGAFMKMLADDMSPVLLAWLRFVVYAAILAPIVAWRYGHAFLKPTRPLVQIIRGVMLAAGNTAFIIGVVHVDYANAIAILYVYPFFMVGMSALILSEKVSPLAWLGVAGGFCGVLMVMRPDPAALNIGAFFILFSGFSVAVQMLLNRKLGQESNPLLVSIWGALVATIALGFTVPFNWQMPTQDQIMVILLIGGLSALSHTIMIMAMTLAPAEQIAPFTYLEIIAGIVIGVVMFGTVPDLWSWAGMVLIISSGLVVKYLSARRPRKA